MLEALIAISVVMALTPVLYKSVVKKNEQIKIDILASQIQNTVKYLETYVRVKNINWANNSTHIITKSTFKNNLTPYGFVENTKNPVLYSAIIKKYISTTGIPTTELYLISESNLFNDVTTRTIIQKIKGYQSGYIKDPLSSPPLIYNIKGIWEITDIPLSSIELKKNNIIIKSVVSGKNPKFLHRDLYTGETNLNVMEADLYLNENDINYINKIIAEEYDITQLLTTKLLETEELTASSLSSFVFDKPIYLIEDTGTGGTININDELTINKKLLIKDNDISINGNINTQNGTRITINNNLNLSIGSILSASNLKINKSTGTDSNAINTLTSNYINIDDDITTNEANIDKIQTKNLSMNYTDSTNEEYYLKTNGNLKLYELKLQKIDDNIVDKLNTLQTDINTAITEANDKLQ